MLSIDNDVTRKNISVNSYQDQFGPNDTLKNFRFEKVDKQDITLEAFLSPINITEYCQDRSTYNEVKIENADIKQGCQSQLP